MRTLILSHSQTIAILYWNQEWGIGTHIFCSSGYDCGVYALCFVEVMCKIKLLKEPEDQLQSVSEETVQQWRRGTKQLITDLAKENNV